MFTSLEIFQSAHASATRAAQQQAIVAENIAHADTPDFKAMTLSDQSMADRPQLEGHQMRVSRNAHINIFTDSAPIEVVEDQTGSASPNGNTVSIANETLKSIEAERRHSRAITVYQSALGILRTSVGRGR